MTFGGKDNRGPSIAELQRYIREKIQMKFKLNTGEEIVGVLRWFDEHAFSVQPAGEQPFTILRNAVVGYRKQNGDAGKPAPSAAKKETGSSPAGENADGGNAAEQS
jgi:hypothetical protein